MEIKINKLQKILNIKFNDINILIQAITHKSFNSKINYETLEFLGDRVLGLTISKKLLELYPNEKVGILDKKFAKMVNRKTCCEVAWSIGIQKYIIIADIKKKITYKDEKILSDCIEALIGSVYIDLGFDFAKNFILRIWKKFIDKSDITILDPKTKLQEYSLKNYKKLPSYHLIGSSGPKHKPIYKISVNIKKSKKFIGIGYSKQEAEQNGADKLLKNINIT